MPKDEQFHTEWQQLVEDWRSAWDKWNEIMDRITLAFSRFESPPDEDLELADHRKEQAETAMGRMEDFQKILMVRTINMNRTSVPGKVQLSRRVFAAGVRLAS